MNRTYIHLCLFAAFLLFVSVTGALAQAPAAGAPQAPPVPRLELYGFVMTDFGFDLRQNDPNWFDVVRPTKLPSFEGEFGNDGRTYAGVRQSRFGAKGYQQTSLGELRTHFEWELFGTGVDAGQTTIRPRHMYGEIGAFGAGQTWSPFMDIDIFPNIVEYWGPNGMVFFRNVQVRWMPVRGESFVTLALERPGASQDIGLLADRPRERIDFQNVTPRFPWPDLSGDARYDWGGGYIEGAGIVRSIKLDDLVDDAFNFDDSLVGWGVSISSNLRFGEDVIRLQYVIGEGIQNYMNDAPVDVAAEPNFGDPLRPVVGKALPMTSWVAFLDHRWSDQWTTSAGYSQLDIDNTVLQSPRAFHRGQYGILNLLHTPAENIMYGGELQWGRRTNFNDGFATNDYRIQFSFKFNFAATIGG